MSKETLSLGEALYRTIARIDRISLLDRPPRDVLAHLEDRLSALIDRLPSGSGFDDRPTMSVDVGRLIVAVPWHEMNEYGYYTGWATVRLAFDRTLSGFDLRVLGTEGGDDPVLFEEYVADTYFDALTQPE